jgi:flagellar hook-associated protein 1 FlgK
MSINSILNTSKDSLITYQLAIGLTGSNIANVNTPGYSRQTPVFQTTGSVDVAAKRAQLSVKVDSIQRNYDQYLQSQIVNQTKALGYSEAKNDILERIEGIFGETTGGADDLLSEFWNAWEELSADPTQKAARDLALSAAENFASTIRRIDDDLTQVVTDTTDRVNDMVAQINITLSEIADLNVKITAYAQDTGDANAFVDSRTVLLNELSDMLDISYIEDEKGAVDVFLSDGRAVILGSKSLQLAVETQSGVVSDIVYQDDPDTSLKDAIASGKSGRLAAFLELSETVIPGYRNELDAFVATLVSEVNTLHHQGYDAEGNIGGDFFEPTTDAGGFRLSDAVSSDLNRIAASATVNSDGDNALAIAEIRDKLVMSGNSATLGDYYASLVGEIGRDVAEAQNDVDYRTSVWTQLENSRESISGVSLDEEMMNLIKYQMSYDTSGKMVSTVSEMLDTLMELVS